MKIAQFRLLLPVAMRFIADLHIHSCYSRATSRASRLPGLAAWAAIKGIRVLATGDFTHPGWLQHLSENLEPAEPGLFKLRSWNNDEIASLVPPDLDCSRLQLDKIRFLLSSEISSIYKKDGKVRKIHNILYAPDFASVRRINKKLAGIGNLESDGRPILGLDARDLLAVAREMAPEGFFVPAHIWTPWFSLFGSKSGFDALEECFGDLSSEIFALETGLSSDPDMNRCISALDQYTLISNSDCHSPAKLGREVNILETELSFSAIRNALRTPVDSRGNRVFHGTVEFYPEEGKYHCDGHRKCHVCMEPDETIRRQGKCPVCGKPVTVGVLHRVMELADRNAPVYAENAPQVFSLIPLPEILGELLGVGPASKTVMRNYARVINSFSSEFNLLLDVPLEEISHRASPSLAEAIHRVRRGRVIRRPGYDGEFGVIRVFEQDELSRLAGQLELFGTPVGIRKRKKKKSRIAQTVQKKTRKKKEQKRSTDKYNELNLKQQGVVTSSADHILVQAGPGTGKTHTLVARLQFQLHNNPGPATVITFTNKAAAEIRQRITSLDEVSRQSVFIATLHGFCLRFLRKQDPLLRVAGADMRMLLLRRLFPEKNISTLRRLSEQFSRLLTDPGGWSSFAPETVESAKIYSDLVDRLHLIDLEAIIPCALALLKKNRGSATMMRRQSKFLYIDEFQDLNAVQYQLVMELARSSSIFAIGDPDQAIYGFRGADPQWFFQFIREMSPEVHSLDINYRCDKIIVQAAAQVIANNTYSGTVAVAHSSRPGRIFQQSCSSAYEEARFVVRRIEHLIGGTSHREIEKLAAGPEEDFSLSDIGILYRTGRQADIISDALFAQGLPFQRVDLEPFYLHKPVKPLYLWSIVAANICTAADFISLLAMEPGIGKKTVQKVETALSASHNPLKDFLLLAENKDKLRQAGQHFRELLQRLLATCKNQGVAAGLAAITGHYNIVKDDPEIARFFRISGAIGDSLPAFATYLQENSRSIVAESPGETVTLMTLHAAKGTQFPVVFIIGLQEGTLPIQPREQLSRAEFKAHIDEERRLFFVGMTRAEHQLYLSWSHGHPDRAGKGGFGRPSRFLADIDSSLFSKAPSSYVRKRRYKQLTLFPQP